MNIKKLVYALLVSMVLVIALLPCAAFAEEAGEAEKPAEPVSAEWKGSFTLKGVIGSSALTNLETPDLAQFEVKYSDDTVKPFIYRVYRYKYDDSDEEYTVGAFYDEEYYDPEKEPESNAAYIYPYIYSDDAEPVEFKEGWNDVKIGLSVPYVVSGKGTPDEEVDYKEILVDTKVLCAPARPVKVEFLPAEGFTPNVNIGTNYLSIYSFYGEGNAFRVTYQQLNDETGEYDEYTTTYSYAKGVDVQGEEQEGFFMKGDVDLKSFEIEDLDCSLEKGKNEVELSYVEYVEDIDDDVTVPFTIELDAEKYYAYASWKVYAYTGKIIKPTFKVWNSADEVVPASEYTLTLPKNKNLGWYDVTITFKDEFKDKYTEPEIIGSYGIGPVKPVIGKLSTKKKTITVNWKKFTKTQLKSVDGLYIETATNKSFTSGYKTYKVSGKTLKSGKKVIKKLKKGKKYFVRIYAYKKVKQGSESYYMFSDDSKIKSIKVK